ncbi:MAG: hypothetical protein AAF960_07535 [Bacteroidota bacterium]
MLQKLFISAGEDRTSVFSFLTCPNPPDCRRRAGAFGGKVEPFGHGLNTRDEKVFLKSVVLTFLWLYKSFFLLFLLTPFLSYGQLSSVKVDSLGTKTEKALPDFHTSTTIFQKIQQDSFFEIILQTNFDSLLKNKRNSIGSYPGKISLKNNKGESIKLKVKVEPRGKSRRRVCSMPPLKIDFPKKDLAKLGLYPSCDKLKLVTNCNDTENSDQVLLKEYWIYRLYNAITPESFKVALVKITYVNSNNTDERIVRYGFFIENNEELSNRLDGEIVNQFGVQAENITENSYHNTILFQYMVANLDWSVLMNRNIKYIKKEGQEKLIVVPYDFDYSGLVKAPHARLNPDFGQKRIEERFPMGTFSSKQALYETADRFLNLQKEELRCYLACPVLQKSVKKKMTRFLNEFFAILKDRRQLETLFLPTN